MKLYVFMVITIGLMYLLGVGGIDTQSSKVIDFLQMDAEQMSEAGNITLNPTITATTTGSISSASTFWVALVSLFVLFGLLTAVKINIGFAQLQATTEGIIATFAAVIFGLFAIDFFSVLRLVYTLTGGTGWQYHLTWILIVPYLVGFAISLIQFIIKTE